MRRNSEEDMVMRRTGRIKRCVVTAKRSGNNLGGPVDKRLGTCDVFQQSYQLL